MREEFCEKILEAGVWEICKLEKWNLRTIIAGRSRSDFFLPTLVTERFLIWILAVLF